MNNKYLFLFIFSLLLISFTYAVNIESGTQYNSSNLNYVFTAQLNFTCTQLQVTDECIIITGGTYAGSYCFNLTSPYLDDVVAFQQLTPINSYVKINSSLPGSIPLYYNWIINDTIILSGTENCELNTDCLINELTKNYTSYADQVQINISFNQSWYNDNMFTSNILQVEDVGVCNAINIYPIINISYYDEVSGDNINVTNAYNINLYDGLNEKNILGSFSDNYNDQFCTSLNPTIEQFNLLLYGSFSISKSGYATRVFTFPFSSGIITSNDPVTNQSLFIIALNESATITYNWLTDEFTPVNGVMLIYECNINGTKTLVDSTQISDGVASSNLRLFTTTYSYVVDIDGTLYTDASYNNCHVENLQTRTFYIDTSETNLEPTLGLFTVDCALTKVSNTTAKLEWASLDGEIVQGCLIGQIANITEKTILMEECLSGANTSLIRVVPTTTDLIVTGIIKTGNQTGYCKGYIEYNPNTTKSSFTFGNLGVLAFFFLMLATILLYAHNSELSLFAVILSLIIGALLTIFNFSWATIISLIFYIIVIIYVGRNTKKGDYQ